MIGIVFILDLEYAPYINRYTEIIEKTGKEYEIITWSRIKDSENYRVISYKKRANLGDGKFKKLFDFLNYSRFLKKTIKTKKYEKLIVLTTISGFLIFNLLLGKYKERFVFDIRDYSYEKIKPYKFIEALIIKRSFFTVISSEGFLRFLPKSNKYVICHNILPKEIENANVEQLQYYGRPNNKIIISFIGAVRHFELNKRMIDIFINDERFELRFHGNGRAYEAIKEYVKMANASNVKVTGKYDRSDKNELMKGVTLINGYYSEKEIANTTAISNKYYDSMIYHIPFWGNPLCYVGQLAVKKGIGINAFLNETIKDKIIEQIDKLDYSELSLNCEKELEKVLDEDREFERKITEFINDDGKKGHQHS